MNIKRAGDVLAHEILYAYTQGLFPMAESADDPKYAWYRPDFRGIFEMDGFHASRSLRRFYRAERAHLRFAYDLQFEAVMDACADRETTWINPTIRDAFVLLHQNDYAHSFEVYHHDRLIGGTYGLTLGGAFFGESMFSRATNGSKLALGALIPDLAARGYTLFDTQFLNSHLESLGAIEIPHEEYMSRLDHALELAPAPIPKGDIALPAQLGSEA